MTAVHKGSEKGMFHITDLYKFTSLSNLELPLPTEPQGKNIGQCSGHVERHVELGRHQQDHPGCNLFAENIPHTAGVLKEGTQAKYTK